MHHGQLEGDGHLIEADTITQLEVGSEAARGTMIDIATRKDQQTPLLAAQSELGRMNALAILLAPTMHLHDTHTNASDECTDWQSAPVTRPLAEWAVLCIV